MRYLLLIAIMVIALPASAAQVRFTWELGTVDCEGTPVAPADYNELEIVVSQEQIPAVADACAVSPKDEPPANATVVNAVPADGEVLTNLEPGQYFARARVSNNAGEWSNFSGELSFLVVKKPLNPPILIRLGL